MEAITGKRDALQDAFLMLAAVLLLAACTFHPSFFGDELFSFNFAKARGYSFVPVFNALNEYKPRLLMNTLWAWVASRGLPRSVPMAVNTIAMWFCCLGVYFLCRRYFDCSRRLAIAAALVVAISRFSIMLYWDYVSGTVETLSLAAFLGALVVSARAILEAETVERWRLALSGVLIVCVVMIHERYLAGIFSLAAAASLIALFHPRGNARWRLAAAAAAICVVALALVLIVTRKLSTMPLGTGTSGQVVSLGMGTVRNFFTYVANVFFGTNFGPNWFVGKLNQDSPLAPAIFGISAAVFAAAWTWPFIVRRKDNISGDYRPALVLLCGTAGMIAAASLPVADRQEARWMFPVTALVVLAAMCIYRGWARVVILSTFAASSLLYFQFGSMGVIANIKSSRTARDVGQMMNSVDFPGKKGLLVGATEPDASWVLGGDGTEFCRLNTPGSDCLYPKAALAAHVLSNPDFGLMPTDDGKGGIRYRLLNSAQLQNLLAPKSLSNEGLIVGGAAQWDGWTLSTHAKVTPEGLVVDAVSDNFVMLPICALQGSVMAVSAEALSVAPSPMRMQVNWQDAAGQFISAQIEVVQPTKTDTDFAMLLSPPDNAATGAVYATLHDGAVGADRIRSIRLSGGQPFTIGAKGGATCH
jgi:hypothetical protein